MLDLSYVTQLVRIGNRGDSIASRLRGRKGRPAESVTFEFGRGEPSIIATVRANGRALLRFGSGEEYAGPYEEMPVGVVHGARQLLETAGPWSKKFSPANQPRRDSGPVRILVQVGEEIREFDVTLADLRDPHSALAPLWGVFTAWLEPLLVVLFGDTPGYSGAESPALLRARGLCLRRRT